MLTIRNGSTRGEAQTWYVWSAYNVRVDVRDVTGQFFDEGLQIVEERFPDTYKSIMRTIDRLNSATSATDFQSVGLACRDILIEFGKAVFSIDYVPEDSDVPGKNDAKKRISIALSELGPSDASRELRKLVETAWDYPLTVQHDRRAEKRKAERAVIYTVLAVIETSEIEQAAAAHDFMAQRHGMYKCPVCTRIDLQEETMVDYDVSGPYLVGHYLICECGWSSLSGIGGAMGPV